MLRWLGIFPFPLTSNDNERKALDVLLAILTLHQKGGNNELYGNHKAIDVISKKILYHFGEAKVLRRLHLNAINATDFGPQA